jgi:murein DD-endopeptidase MepM/ murein hydrolase activator NlpD
MILKFRKKTYTLVVIPDPNRPVVRMKLTNVVVISVIAALALLLIASLSIYVLHLRSIVAMQQLHSELTGSSRQYAATLSTKEQTIEQLQNEVIKLSQQSKEMKARVDEMAKLESDLKSIAQIGGGTGGSVAVQPGSGTEGASQGGAFNPVSDEEIVQLSADTSSALTKLGEQLNNLQTSMTETKQKVLVQQHQLRITPTLFPTMTRFVTSPFGYRTDPINGLPSFHSGIDFGAAFGDDVFATADGTVASVGSDASHGNNIIINHGQGIKTWYMHLSKTLVSAGDTVTKGQRIGLVGSTGRSTGPHLHYELIKNGKSIDPKPYLQTMRKDDN